MFTVVLKNKVEDILIFEVFKKTFFCRQKVVGNIFCIRDEEGKYKASSSFYMASWPKFFSIHWDGGKKSYELERKAIWICEHLMYNYEIYQGYDR